MRRFATVLLAAAAVFSALLSLGAEVSGWYPRSVIRVSLKEAEGRLGKLMQAAAAGQEVVITSDGGPTVRLLPQMEAETPRADQAPKSIGCGLDRFIGTWTAEQEAEVLAAVQIFEQVDESFWA